MTRWMGPYQVEKCHENASVQIKTIDKEGILLHVNGNRLKLYKKPLSKEEFVSSINRDLNIIVRLIALIPLEF